MNKGSRATDVRGRSAGIVAGCELGPEVHELCSYVRSDAALPAVVRRWVEEGSFIVQENRELINI
jgi:hypothetical protein